VSALRPPQLMQQPIAIGPAVISANHLERTLMLLVLPMVLLPTARPVSLALTFRVIAQPRTLMAPVLLAPTTVLSVTTTPPMVLLSAPSGTSCATTNMITVSPFLDCILIYIASTDSTKKFWDFATGGTVGTTCVIATESVGACTAITATDANCYTWSAAAVCSKCKDGYGLNDAIPAVCTACTGDDANAV